MKKVFILSTAILLNLFTHAQFKYGAELGLNLSSIRYDNTDTSVYANSLKAGFKLGGFSDLHIWKKLYLQPGIYYSQKGGKVKALGTSLEMRINYVEIPINLQYRLVESKIGSIFLGAGPYLGYAIGGNYKAYSPFFPDQNRDLMLGNDFTSDLKEMDFGLNVNFCINLKKSWLLRFQRGFGLTENSPVLARTTKNGCASISVAYVF